MSYFEKTVHDCKNDSQKRSRLSQDFKMTDTKTRPKYKAEVLAPAGCYPSLQAAINAGADAVYFGLGQLNMRARARKSFHIKDLPEIISRCKEANVLAYLTLNTLLYDHDVILTRKMLETAKEHGIDGVIVADMAAIQMANELGIECHISTQLSISNYQSFKFYAQFSDRIVLARELNLTMIKKIHEQAIAEDLRGPAGRPIEIEVFAHGALCVAVSGRCGMSLHTSNASANRGACEQNCRKEYTVTDTETGQQLKVDNNFIMSPNDINTIDFMDQFLDAGIYVLKIEGRGRSPEYVHTVTSAYRKAVDAVNDGSYAPEFVDGLYKDLEKVYNRGMSSGYYLGREQGWSATYGSKATRQKLHAGKVTNFYDKIGVAEFTLEAGTLEVGEEYVIIGETSGVIEGEVIGIRLDEGPVDKVIKDQVFSMKVSEKVRRNDKLYKMKTIEAK